MRYNVRGIEESNLKAFQQDWLKCEFNAAPILYRILKGLNEDSIVFLKVGEMYETYCDDAKLVSVILGVELKYANTDVEEKTYRFCNFPQHLVCEYITKLHKHISSYTKIILCDEC